MTTIIDARGLACPQPVIRVKQALAKGVPECYVLVDNAAAKENVIRFAENAGAVIDGIVAADSGFRIAIRSAGASAAVAAAVPPCSLPATAGKTVVLSCDRMGHGDDELGKLLMGAFLYALTQCDRKPRRLILMNHGVRLAAVEQEAVPRLRELVAGGVELLVCGTCLDFLKLKDDLKLGTVSNMYTIAECLLDDSNALFI